MAKKINRNALLAKVHILRKQLEQSEDHYRDMLADLTKKRSAADLNAPQLLRLIDHMNSLLPHPDKGGRGGGAFPGRPRNMDSYNSRAAQLGKIEALLTIGGKSWAYGDALAQRICKVDKISWVADGDLYKIITALRMQAKREGWDLSGEGR